MRYRVLSVDDTQGVQLLGRDDGRSRDYSQFPNYPRSFTVAPHTTSVYYTVVEVRVKARVTSAIEGCTVRYRVGGVAFTQKLSCDFSLDGS